MCTVLYFLCVCIEYMSYLIHTGLPNILIMLYMNKNKKLKKYRTNGILVRCWATMNHQSNSGTPIE